MPAEQQGSVYKTSKGFGLRWYDETGTAADRRASRPARLRVPGSGTSKGLGCVERRPQRPR